MTRREFPTKVRAAVIKRCMRDNGVIYCEACGLPTKRFQVDHVVADAHGGKPVIENAMLICEPCFSEKNPRDTTIAAKLKRVEANHIGARVPTARPIPQRPKVSTRKQPRIAKTPVPGLSNIARMCT